MTANKEVHESIRPLLKLSREMISRSQKLEYAPISSCNSTHVSRRRPARLPALVALKGVACSRRNRGEHLKLCIYKPHNVRGCRHGREDRSRSSAAGKANLRVRSQ